VEGAGPKRRRFALAALGGALAVLVAAAQPVSGNTPAGHDTIHANLEGRLDELDSGRRLSIIVQLDEPAGDERITALEDEVGPLAIGRRFSIVNGFSASATREQIEALARAPGVRQIEANPVLYGANDAARAAFGVSKARLDLPSLDGAGVTVAVLDSGIHATHPDLDEGKVKHFKDFVNHQTAPYDDNGHGTHVSAIVAGDGDGSGGLYSGVAPGASIVSLKVLDESLKGIGGAVLGGIDWAIWNQQTYGIRMIVLALQSDQDVCSDGTEALSVAVNNAASQGLLVVVAAGNRGPGQCSIGTPASASGALTVGAMADTGEGGFYLAPFSSRGPTLDGRVKPDVVAPGVGITSAKPPATYEARNGTSMAAPFVAGVAALMLDANPSLSPGQLKSTIMSTASDWARGGDNAAPGTIGPDVDYGAGRVDAYAAIRAAGAGLASPPPTPTHELHQGTVSGSGSHVDHGISVTDTAFPIAATLIAPGSSPPDLDLALFNPAGTEVAASRLAGTRQEQISFRPATIGTYTLRVSSRSGAGSYFADVSGAISSQALNGELPAIAGGAREGAVLRAGPGVWSGSHPLTFVLQWLRCNGGGDQCNPIPGSSGQEYQLAAADIDSTIRVRVTATNGAGSNSVTSPPTATVLPLAPRNVDPPTIVGTARDGSAIHVERGSWLSSRPLSVTHQWQRCQGAGGGCTAIPGATSATLTLGRADIGATVTAIVTAANTGGQESVTATPVAVGAQRPETTKAPVVTGRARTGAVLRAEEGLWKGTRPLDYQLRWQRCGYDGRGCETIRGVGGPRYRVKEKDAGRRLRVRVRASNGALPGGGQTIAYSGFTRIVQPEAAWFEAGAGRVALLTGTRRRDVIRGTAGPDIIRGLGGNDRILGRGGNDLIIGGPGRDTLYGGKGDDDLRGGLGDDLVHGGPGQDLLSGGRGYDRARTVGKLDFLNGIERRR
jgi:serine protease AprX